MSKMPWFRVYSEILDDKKIKRICRITGKSKALVIGIWISLLALANDSGERGKLTISDDIPYEMYDFIEETGCDETLLSEMMKHFIDLGMIEKASNIYEIKNWDGRQFKSDNSTQRVKDWRAKQSEISQPENVKRYKGVIDSDTESDTDSESDTNNNNKDDSLFDACMEIYQTKKGLPITDGRAFALMIDEFQKYGVTAEDYAAAIDAMDADKNYKGTRPTSYKKWAIGYRDKRKRSDKKRDADQNPDSFRKSWLKGLSK